MASGIELIAAERTRQIEKKGWTTIHDDGHSDGDLALAAVCYATPVRLYREVRYADGPQFSDPWPWEDGDKRERTRNGNVLKNNRDLQVSKRIRQLVKAGALIAAEIDRLQRKAGAP